MALLVFADRVKENTATTGVGTYSLAGALVSFQSFAAIGDGNSCVYGCTDGSNWEVGIGTYSSAGTSLTRDTILDSSNAGSAVNWGVGNKVIYNTPTAEYAKQQFLQRWAAINYQTGTSYILTADDDGAMIEMDNAAPITLTVPLISGVPFENGTRIDVIQLGAGQVTVSHAGTLRGGAKTVQQYSALSLYKRANDDWVVIGGTT